MKNPIQRILVVVTVALNVLAASYYLWTATGDGAFERNTFTAEAFPFAALYFGRLLTPILSVAALLLTPKKPA